VHAATACAWPPTAVHAHAAGPSTDITPFIATNPCLPEPSAYIALSFTNFGTANGHAFGGEYLELEPGERIRYTAAEA
jgi:hypothetical protein